MTGHRQVRVGSVVIDCLELKRMKEFWTAALGYAPDAAGESDDWCRLDDPDGRVNVSLQVVPDPTPGKNKLHLDLYTSNREAEVGRLMGLGAAVARLPTGDEDFVVMSDPEGNLFCVVAKGSEEHAGLDA